MRILIIGGGGREHALGWRLCQEAEVISAPGNPGLAECGAMLAMDPIDAARHCIPDLILIGPEDPLIAGLADHFREEGRDVLGPGREGARHEASKSWSKTLMKEAGVPTAAFGIYRDFAPAQLHAAASFEQGKCVVVKASGAALGKGAVVCRSLPDAERALHEMLVDGLLGEAGREVVVEDCVPGREFSLLTLVNESGIFSLPVAQDYKRIFDGDQGPNTGGMGTCSPVNWVTNELVQRAEEEVVRPMVQAMLARGITYRGVLFSGLMFDEDQLNCLEYNVRFGDPETQTVMRRLHEGLSHALLATAQGQPIPPVAVRNEAAITVVLANEGYPGEVIKGRPIILPEPTTDVEIFHAGTKLVEGQLIATGGRVLGVSAIGADLDQARAKAYACITEIQLEGGQIRSDIGSAAV